MSQRPEDTIRSLLVWMKTTTDDEETRFAADAAMGWLDAVEERVIRLKEQHARQTRNCQHITRQRDELAKRLAVAEKADA